MDGRFDSTPEMRGADVLTFNGRQRNPLSPEQSSLALVRVWLANALARLLPVWPAPRTAPARVRERRAEPRL
jgi:hypothetical protein